MHMPTERPNLASLPTFDVEASLSCSRSELDLTEAKGVPESLQGRRHVDLDRPFGIERVVLVRDDVELEQLMISGQVAITVDRVEETHAEDRRTVGIDAVGRKIGSAREVERVEDVGWHHHILGEGGSL